MTRFKHFVGLLGSLALAVLPVWADPQQTLVARFAVTISTGLFLAISTAQLKTQRNAILGGLAIAAVAVAAIAGRFSPGSAGLAVVGTLAAILTQVRAILARELADVPADSTKITS
jgi:hypothetical protein